MNTVNRIFNKLFHRITPIERAAYELNEALLAKLEADSAGEYADAISAYNQSRIERLRVYLKGSKA